MDNIVRLGSDRPRPRRFNVGPRTGAQILFFTGVRYCRDEAETLAGLPAAHVIHDRHARAVESGLDLAAH